MKFIQVIILIFFVGMLLSSVKAQPCKSAAKTTEESGQCANELIFFSKIRKVGKIMGRVTDRNGAGLPAVVDIYYVPGPEIKKKLDLLAQGIPFRKFETDENGEFCLENLPKAYYVVRIGAKSGGFNCVFYKVKLVNDGSAKTLEITLPLGT